ncbi:ribonuclease domain-containing protein [uncultured Chryseobacterium sp.]|uniref:ribonuclease domain-containing protein n=1 Tax=uncultured Chryseobacterium sp. TaxID=259322 RepID=UPI0025F739B9|nr:ribonuclease domain-containing protein [uncultured Chryseobacterium sp.]
MNNKTRPLFFICLGLLFGMSVMYVYKNFIADTKPVSTERVSEAGVNDSRDSFQQSIDQLTEEKTVIHYIKQNHKLPDYYITKNQARNLGWNPSKGNLCEVAPGKAIGGDRFGNREKILPEDKEYFEADVNYHCGSRQADRIVFTKDGEVYLSKNHYKSFEKQ